MIVVTDSFSYTITDTQCTYDVIGHVICVRGIIGGLC